MNEEHLFIGFDCAYRTFGWCIMGYNPHALLRMNKLQENVQEIEQNIKNIFHLIGSGVEDVLGENIDQVDHSTRAKRLLAVLRAIIPPEVVTRSVVIIEHQPRRRGRGFRSGVYDFGQTIETQLIYHFSVVCPAAQVYVISGSRKNKLACQLLNEEPVYTYSDRKKQSRRAFVELSWIFDFDVCSYAHNYKHVKADQADACVQIIAAIFLCAKNIDCINYR